MVQTKRLRVSYEYDDAVIHNCSFFDPLLKKKCDRKACFCWGFDARSKSIGNVILERRSGISTQHDES